MEVTLYDKIRYNKEPGWWAPIVHPDVDQDIWTLYWLMRYEELKKTRYDRCVYIGKEIRSDSVVFFHRRFADCWGPDGYDEWTYQNINNKWQIVKGSIRNYDNHIEGCCGYMITILIDNNLLESYIRKNRCRDRVFRIAWLQEDRSIFDQLLSPTDDDHNSQKEDNMLSSLGNLMTNITRRFHL